jgi:hypothetical protein
MDLLSDTHLKLHERLYIPNYHMYRIDQHPERKSVTAVAVGKCIPRSRAVPPPLVSVEATGVNTATGNSEIRLAAVYISSGRNCSDAGFAKFSIFRNKCILAGDLYAKHQFWNSAASNP